MKMGLLVLTIVFHAFSFGGTFEEFMARKNKAKAASKVHSNNSMKKDQLFYETFEVVFSRKLSVDTKNAYVALMNVKFENIIPQSKAVSHKKSLARAKMKNLEPLISYKIKVPENKKVSLKGPGLVYWDQTQSMLFNTDSKGQTKTTALCVLIPSQANDDVLFGCTRYSDRKCFKANGMIMVHTGVNLSPNKEMECRRKLIDQMKEVYKKEQSRKKHSY